MPKISKEKEQRIKEQIIDLLYKVSPQAIFTGHIAREIARDEEFVKKLLYQLEEAKIVIKIKKSPKGKEYLRKERWRLSPKVYEIMKTKMLG